MISYTKKVFLVLAHSTARMELHFYDVNELQIYH